MHLTLDAFNVHCTKELTRSSQLQPGGGGARGVLVVVPRHAPTSSTAARDMMAMTLYSFMAVMMPSCRIVSILVMMSITISTIMVIWLCPMISIMSIMTIMYQDG